MESDEIVTLTRNCTGTLIPYGEQIMLNKGEQARITQALGGNYSLLIRGSLVRIEGKDADAIGKKPIGEPELPIHDDYTGPVDENAVWDAMKSCYDPEIPVNIVDLGLIYSCEIFPREKRGSRVEVKMTLTAPGCGIGGMIADEVATKIRGVPGVADVDVELVWDPPWNQDMMSETAKLHLGML